MKRFLLSLMAISLVAVGCFSFSQDNDWIQYGEDEHGGTITVYSPDGSYGIVIQNKNLGAIVTGAGKNAPTESYGNFYQWGNNYGFPSDPNVAISITGTKVDTSPYGPENPYSSSTFVTGTANYHDPSSDWSIELNDNLRGGTGDDETNGWGLISNNPITGRKGPCPEGYHIPSIGEFDELAVIWYNNKYNADLSTGYLIEEVSLQQEDTRVSSDFAEDLMIPFTSMRYGDNGEVETGLIGFLGNFWSSTPYSEWGFTFSLIIHNFKSGILKYAVYADIGNYRSTALSLRCFKDERVYPQTFNTLTLSIETGNNIVSTGIDFSDKPLTSGQVLGAIEWLASEVELATGYHFAWYTDDGGVETGFDLDIAVSQGTITSSLSLTGKIEPNKYTISFLNENGVEIMSGEFTYGQEANLPANTSAKEGYTFKGWNDSEGNTYDDGTSIKNLTTEDGAVLEFTPIWEPNKYIISFLDDDGAEIMSGEFTYDQEANLPANTSTKEGYTFKGWKDSQGNTYADGAIVKNLTTENGAILQFTPIWEKQESKPSGGGSSGGGGRGGGSKATDSQTNTHGSANNEKSDEDLNDGSETDDSLDDLEVVNYNPDLPDNQQTLSDGLTPEMHEAYQWAYRNGITTMPTILEADMYGPLDRISMAKMLSTYAIKILGITPDTDRVNQFVDVTPELDAEFNNGVTLAYQLGIMGINMYNNEFRPFDLVPRSEFGTALSRMLYQLSDGVYEKTDEFYIPHFNKLSVEGIMTVLDPTIEELRGYVMIMLMRSAKKSN